MDSNMSMDEIRDFSVLPQIRCVTCGKLTIRMQEKFDEIMEEKRIAFESFFLEIFTALVTDGPQSTLEELLTQVDEEGNEVLTQEEQEHLRYLYEMRVEDYVDKNRKAKLEDRKVKPEFAAYYYVTLARLYILLGIDDRIYRNLAWWDVQDLWHYIYSGMPDYIAKEMAEAEADKISGNLFNYFVTDRLGLGPEKYCCRRTLMTPIILPHGDAVDLDPEVNIGKRMSELQIRPKDKDGKPIPIRAR